MFSRFLSLVVISVAVISACSAAGTDLPVLRVCADPNNLPFSNQQEQGFENRIASLLASSLNATLQYTWWAERKSLVSNTLQAGRCDVLLGAPAGLQEVDLTDAYYTSTYVFVSRKQEAAPVTSLNDPRLANLRIGIHVVGNDYAPPGHALARRGLAANLHGYSLFGEYGEPNPPARLIHAIADKEVDIAIVWGPFAGYFAPREKQALDIRRVTPASDMGIPFSYSISMAVKQGNEELRDRLNGALRKLCPAIERIVNDYGVPRAYSESGGTACEASPVSPSAVLR